MDINRTTHNRGALKNCSIEIQCRETAIWRSYDCFVDELGVSHPNSKKPSVKQFCVALWRQKRLPLEIPNNEPIPSEILENKMISQLFDYYYNQILDEKGLNRDNKAKQVTSC